MELLDSIQSRIWRIN